jgi:hypothetical protein
MPRGTRSSRRAGQPARPGRRRGLAGKRKTGGTSRRRLKLAGKRGGVTSRKGASKQRKALRTRNKGRGRVRGRQSGGGGKTSSLTARPVGRTLGVALAGQSPPAGAARGSLAKPKLPNQRRLSKARPSDRPCGIGRNKPEPDRLTVQSHDHFAEPRRRDQQSVARAHVVLS